jgi:hypothetical protein
MMLGVRFRSGQPSGRDADVLPISMRARHSVNILVFVGVIAATGHAQLRSLETPHLRLITLDDASGYLLPHTARCFENALRFHSRLFDYTPSEPVTMLLHDFNDYGSGGTSTMPWNYLSIGIEPFDYVYETSPTNERMNWVMNHELVHMLATDKAAGPDRFFRSLFFGKVAPTADQPVSMAYSFLTTPRWYSPRWYHEGCAVFMETWMAGGIGRVLGGYDEMVFRTMVHDSSMFYDYVGLESEGTTIDFEVGANAYLYGTRFVSYLALQYGPESVLRWCNRTADSERYFASQFEQVYGTPLGDEWSRWIAWEHAWQQANLDSLARYPLTRVRSLTPRALGSVSRAFYDSTRGALYVASTTPGTLPRLVEVSMTTGRVSTLCRVTSPALYYVCSLAYDPVEGILFFTNHNGSSWRDIESYNVTTGETTLLLAGARIGDLAFNRGDRSLWGVQHNNGISTLVRIPAPYMGWNDILPLPYGKDLFDLDIAPDGGFLTASVIEINGRQQLIRLSIDSLLNGSSRYDVLHEFENSAPQNFVFSSDGRFLFGTTYYTGVSNVVRYDLAAKTMEWVTNCETGLFRPLPVSGDSLIAFRYTKDGFLPVTLANETRADIAPIRFLGQEIVDRHPIVMQWKIDPPSVINIDSLTTGQGEYEGWQHMGLASAYPIVAGYKDYTAPGVRINFLDPLMVYGTSLTAVYTPSPGVPQSERFHATADAQVWQWRLTASYNASDFYDLFGPTKTSRKGYSALVRYKDYLMYDRPRTLEYNLAAGVYGGLERLPDFQNVYTAADRFGVFNGDLAYTNLRRSLGAVESEDGTAASLSVENTLMGKKWFPRVFGTVDLGVLLPLPHSSLWLRGAGGKAFGDRQNPFANFFLGGFGNNWVDHREVRRYREWYAFPGVELNDVGGATFGKIMLEWTLPPLRFKRLGFPWLYCTWSRIALFGASVAADIDRVDDRRTLADAGVQVDCKLVLFTHLDSTLSFGLATAAEPGRHPVREFMISLKIL